MAATETETSVAEGRDRVPAAVVEPSASPRARGGALAAIVPRQHGAWSILLLGYLLGALAFPGRSVFPAALALVALVAGFVARHAAVTAWELRRNPSRCRAVAGGAAGLSVVALVACAVLILHFDRWGLLVLGGAAALPALVSFAVERAHRDRTAWGEIIGVVGLSAAIPLASYATAGAFDARHVGLWVLGTLYFSGSVFHVRFLVRCWRRRRGSFRERLQAGWASLVWHLGALALALGAAATQLAPAWAPVALVPVTAKALLAFRRGPDAPPVIRTVGFVELAHSLLFAGLALLAFRGAI